MPVCQQVFDENEREQFPTGNIIIIHPGSLYVRMGRASDLMPVKSLQCIARRRKEGSEEAHGDPFLPPSVLRTPQLVDGLEECRLQISHTLQSCVRQDGSRRYATPPQQLATFNRRSAPETLDAVAPKSKPVSPSLPYVVGEDILELEPDAPYNVHFPYRRGDLNLHHSIGGSLTSVLADLAAVWGHVIRHRLGIPLEELDKYRCVLLIPDIYNRSHLKHLVGVLLNELGFAHCFLVQESVGATFGAGMGYACVVDVGDQKTSVCCVEDGTSHKITRLRMDYGAADACQTLSWLLDKNAFPYRAWNEKLPRDAMLIRNLYRDFCHINLDVCGPQEKTFNVSRPGERIQRITVQIGDECIISPLAMFYPDLLSLTGPKNTRTQTVQSGDSEDPFDAEYLRETGRKKDNAEGAGCTSDAVVCADGSLVENQPTANAEEDIVVDALDQVGEGFLLAPGQILGLDTAILQSIDRCPTEELKKKMYSCVLIVGGGVKLQGLTKWLQNKLALQIPFFYRTEQMDMVISPKDTDPCITAWKGAAIMSCLESANELWIHKHEWQRHGIKILRERSPFIW